MSGVKKTIVLAGVLVLIPIVMGIGVFNKTNQTTSYETISEKSISQMSKCPPGEICCYYNGDYYRVGEKLA
jgi:hypothetical protein